MYRPLQFHKRSQHFIRVHDETLSVAMRSTVQIVRPLDQASLKLGMNEVILGHLPAEITQVVA